MANKYQIVIKTLQDGYLYGLYNSGYYSDTCTLHFKHENHECIKEFAENYGKTENVILFLKQLLALFTYSSSPQDRQDWSSLSHEQLIQEVEKIWGECEFEKLAKQELKRQVSDLHQTKYNKEVEKLRREKSDLQFDNGKLETECQRCESEINKLKSDLSNYKNQIDQSHKQCKQTEVKYEKILNDWNKFVPDYNDLLKKLGDVHQIEQENERLKKSKQNLESRVKEIEQELQETQQKLSLATTRLRGINTHSELGGGGSRSDQLKNEVTHLKMGSFHDVSSKILNGWRDQGSIITFRSEEFSRIKSVLSQLVFGDGMIYFAKDKAEVNSELYVVMDSLTSIKDFNPTPAIFQEIQEKVQAGLLQSKGIDHSDEALVKYIEETTQRINQELQLIANFSVTDEALDQIKKFVEAGLKLIRDIVNDPNSGELFIPESGTAFDDNAHDTRDDHKGQIKMTICAGYRIKGTILVKADVMTYEPEPEPETTIQATDLQNQQRDETGQEINNKADSDRDKSTLIEFRSEYLVERESEKSSKFFRGRLNRNLKFRYCPQKDAKTDSEAANGELVDFEAWIVGEPWKVGISLSEKQDARWYKVAGQNWWLPAFHIEGEPPSDMPPMQSKGGEDESQ